MPIPHRITIDEEMLDMSWDQMWADIYLNHFVHPTCIPIANPSEGDKIDDAIYSSMAANLRY